MEKRSAPQQEKERDGSGKGRVIEGTPVEEREDKNKKGKGVVEGTPAEEREAGAEKTHQG